jgi:hypothetical protein
MPAGLEVGAAWWALLALTATLGSLALATYVPLARTDGTSAGGSPCAAAAVVFVVLVGPSPPLTLIVLGSRPLRLG